MTRFRVIALGAFLAAATALVGWWSVPVLAGAYAFARRNVMAPREALLGALFGWLLLFARVIPQKAFVILLDRLSSLFPIPGAGVIVLALVFAMVLAWTSARVVTGVVLLRDAGDGRR